MSNDRTPRRGVLLIVASPSGAGKTSLCRRLMADHKGLELSVSMTTRGIRPGEVDGRDYHFVGHDEFQRLIDEDAFLEWADVHGNRYGSPRGPVDRALAEGRDVLFDIDWQGARDVAEKCPEDLRHWRQWQAVTSTAGPGMVKAQPPQRQAGPSPPACPNAR